MSLIDKFTFEKRGAHGCSNSEYTFALTSCCERVGVVDDELDEFYWDADSPSFSVRLLAETACPFCEACTWSLHRIDDLSQVPEHWRWACDDQPRPGRRRVRTLAEHVAELLAFCQRVASPIPAFGVTLFLDTTDARVRYDDGWKIKPEALLSRSHFEPLFNRLLLTGYTWINLSVYGVFRDALIVGLELPSEAHGVPAGLTAVNYSGPPTRSDGTPNWDLDLTIIHT